MPNNSITTIKDYFARHNGLQRSNRYRVLFSGIPDFIGTDNAAEGEYYANQVVIGPRAIDCVSDNLTSYGSGRTIPRYQKFASGVFLVFPVTNDCHIMKLFDNWFNYLHSGSRSAFGGSGSLGTPYFTNYYDTAVFNATMTIQLLDPNGDPNATYTFYEVMPVETMPVELTMLRSNEYSMYQVLMNYKEFTFS